MLAGIVRLGAATLPLIDPKFSTAIYSCNPCVLQTDVVRLLQPETVRTRVRQTPGAVARLKAHVARPSVKLMLFMSEAVRAVPFFFMFLGMALALRGLAARGFNARSVQWLKRAALAAFVWTVAGSASSSIRWTALSPISDGKQVRHLIIDSDSFLLGIMIAGGAWVIAWALEEAQLIRRDLEEYV